jgi:hypothetical protein
VGESVLLVTPSVSSFSPCAGMLDGLSGLPVDVMIVKY